MKLQYFGHSCFRLISEMGTTVVCDPYDSTFVGLNMPQSMADVVTISHHHGDHDSLSQITGRPAVLDEVVSGGADDIAIDSTETFHDDSCGKLRGNNVVFTYLIDGIKLAHMGDIGTKDSAVVEKLQGTNVLMIPVGGNYTIDSATAKWYVEQIRPQIVLPMHYKMQDSTIDIDGIDSFVALCDNYQVITSNNSTLELYDVPQNSQTQVIVLQKWCE